MILFPFLDIENVSITVLTTSPHEGLLHLLEILHSIVSNTHVQRKRT